MFVLLHQSIPWYFKNSAIKIILKIPIKKRDIGNTWLTITLEPFLLKGPNITYAQGS